jgi:hypothetical protein
MGFGFSSMFDNDDFFSSGFGRMGGGFKSNFDDEPPTRGKGYGMTKSVSTTTKVINGKTTTTKKTTIFK